jgi:hypothetical protein
VTNAWQLAAAAAITSLNASNLTSGKVPLAAIPSAVVTNNQKNALAIGMLQAYTVDPTNLNSNSIELMENIAAINDGTVTSNMMNTTFYAQIMGSVAIPRLPQPVVDWAQVPTNTLSSMVTQGGTFHGSVDLGTGTLAVANSYFTNGYFWNGSTWVNATNLSGGGSVLTNVSLVSPNSSIAPDPSPVTGTQTTNYLTVFNGGYATTYAAWAGQYNYSNSFLDVGGPGLTGGGDDTIYVFTNGTGKTLWYDPNGLDEYWTINFPGASFQSAGGVSPIAPLAVGSTSVGTIYYTTNYVTNTTGAYSLTGIDNAVITNLTVINPLMQPDLQLTNTAAWVEHQASLLDANANYNRWGWTNTLSKIAAKNNFVLLVEGDGLIGTGILTPFVNGLAARFPVAGALTGVPGLLNGLGGSGGALAPSMDTNWHSYYTYLPSSGAAVSFSANYLWNVLRLDYIGMPGGGVFKLQTNSVDTGFTVNTYAATRAGKSAFWTNTVAAANSFEVVQTSGAGTSNIICSVGWYNTNVTNGIIIGEQSGPASDGPQFNILVDSVIRTPIYTSWHPDMIVYESLTGLATNAPYSQSISNWAALFPFWRSCSPAVDLVLCGIYPLAGSWLGAPGYQAFDWGDQGNLANNTILITNAIYLNASYFDGRSPFVSPAMMVSRGFITYENVHATTAGYSAYSTFLDRFLGLKPSQ